MSSISALTSNTSSLAALFGTSSKDTSATSAFAAPESGSETTGSTGSTVSSGSGFAALDGDMQTALLSLQEEMGGTDAAMMAGREHLRDGEPLEILRPCVVGVFQ